MSQMERLYWMDAKMQNGGCLRREDIATKFEVSKRTFFSDIQYLRDRLEAPIQYSKRLSGWLYTEASYRLPFLALSDAKADTLHRTLQVALTYLPPADAQAVQHLALLLSPYLRGLPRHGDDPLSVSSEMFLGGNPTLATPITEKTLADLRRAVEKHHRLRLTYYSAHRNEITERTIQPYLLLNWRGELYLIGYCENRLAERDFAVHRILAHAVLEPAAAYAVPESFDASAFLQRALDLRRSDPLVTVVIRFNPHQARWIRERTYHSSQTLMEEPDGSVVLTMCVAGIADVKRWVLSYGASAEVLKPEELRHDILAEMAAIREVYSDAA